MMDVGYDPGHVGGRRVHSHLHSPKMLLNEWLFSNLPSGPTIILLEEHSSALHLHTVKRNTSNI